VEHSLAEQRQSVVFETKRSNSGKSGEKAKRVKARHCEGKAIVWQSEALWRIAKQRRSMTEQNITKVI
jgi:hypothetical protein